MQIPILNGIYTDNDANMRTSYPVNLVPVPKKTGISNGFLRPADGVIQNGTGPGIGRGGINWNGICYRVMGTKLVSITSTDVFTVLGDVGGSVNDLVTMDYSFDRLAVASGGRLYYWSQSLGLVQVTDPDIGYVISVVWVDGYFMVTDGSTIAVTELNDPMSVNPFKYGSSEIDPDPIVALLKLRNEVYAINSNTIEIFNNIGGSLFPFQRISGAQIQKGSVGTFSCCVFMDNIAFIGGGRNEANGVYLGSNSTATKISTQEIDQLLLQYTTAELFGAQLEARNDQGHQHLYIHLPDRTLVYDAAASIELQEQVWFTLTTSTVGFEKYRARHFVWAYGKWLVSDPLSTSVGYCTQEIGSVWGEIVRWEFGTLIAYNEGNGAIFTQLELVSLTGRAAIGINPIISTSYSLDGLTWSQDIGINIGTTGDTTKRLVWFVLGFMTNWRIQRFRGDSQAHLSFSRIEAKLEALSC